MKMSDSGNNVHFSGIYSFVALILQLNRPQMNLTPAKRTLLSVIL